MRHTPDWRGAWARRRATARVLTGNRNLQRVEFGFGVWMAADWGGLLALSAVAMATEGPKGVGLVGLMRVLPAAILGPLAGHVTDRMRRHRVLAAGHLLAALAFGAVALLVQADAPFGAVLAVVAVQSVVSAAYRPALSSLMPQLVPTAPELVAANAISATIEALGTAAGPAVGGALLALVTPAAAFAALAGLSLVAALTSLTVVTDGQPARAPRRQGLAAVGEMLGGFPALLRTPELRAVVGLFLAQTVVRGLLSVFVVVLAVDSWSGRAEQAGIVFSALGVGALVGSVVTFGGGTRRSALPFTLGVVLWGAPVLVLGLHSTPAVATIALLFVGIGNALEDVHGLTLLNRIVPDHVAGRAFGALFTGAAAAVSLASLAAPVLEDTVGVSSTLVASGAVLVVLALLLWPRVRRIDVLLAASSEWTPLLRQVAEFAPLSEVALEQLARAAHVETAHPGHQVVREGAAATTFYVVVEGELDVVVDGTATRSIGPRDSFGEIALLRETTRTATVRARSAARLLVVSGATFVAAVTGHRIASARADETVLRLLADDAAVRGGAPDAAAGP